MQSQLCLLLNAYYEGLYPENIYSFRKGRNNLQAVSLLNEIISFTNKNELGIVLFNIKYHYNSLPQEVILTLIEIPDK
jgi:hypothetical protein